MARQRYSELLESARAERLASLAERQPEVRERVVSVRGVLSFLRVRVAVVRLAHRVRLGHA
jgi:hypothetical protein